MVFPGVCTFADPRMLGKNVQIAVVPRTSN